MNLKLLKNIKAWLAQYPKARIELSALERQCAYLQSYDAFYELMTDLLDEGVLSPVKASGSNGKSRSLHNKYKINKNFLKKDKLTKINQKILSTSSLLSLEAYFDLPLSVFEADLVYIDLIDRYLKEQGLPEDKFLPELAFELTGDEKWIEKGPGQLILTRLALWDKLSVRRRPDPLAFAINPVRLNEAHHKHLIIENKTAYLHAMHNLRDSVFSTVIYGQGWKILGGFKLFKDQFPISGDHEFYYFGDLDKAGIAIYASLAASRGVYLAKDFYRVMYDKKSYEGKINQQCAQETIAAFVNELKEDELDQGPDYMLKMLEDGRYQPQEILSEEEIARVLLDVRL